MMELHLPAQTFKNHRVLFIENSPTGTDVFTVQESKHILSFVNISRVQNPHLEIAFVVLVFLVVEVSGRATLK